MHLASLDISPWISLLGHNSDYQRYSQRPRVCETYTKMEPNLKEMKVIEMIDQMAG